MTKTRLTELCEIARKHDRHPIIIDGYEADRLYEIDYRGHPLYAHYSLDNLESAMYKGVQYRFTSDIGRGKTARTAVYHLTECHTSVWLVLTKVYRHYSDQQGEHRSAKDCQASYLCDYADLIPIP